MKRILFFLVLAMAAVCASGQRDSLYMTKVKTYQAIDTAEITAGTEYEVLIKYYSTEEGYGLRQDTVDTYADEYIRQLIAQAVSDSVNLKSFLEVHYENYKKANTDYFTLKNYLTALRNVATGAPMSRQTPEASLQPKVLRALVNQAGGHDPQTATSGTLTVGVSYEITTFETGDDFTNVGAPSNANGVKFIATGTTPTVWTEGSTLAWNNGAPIVNILQNTLGNDVFFEIVGDGQYKIISTGSFTENKTTPIDLAQRGGYDGFNSILGGRIDNDTYYIDTFQFSDLTTKVGGVLNNTYIEILVYP